MFYHLSSHFFIWEYIFHFRLPLLQSPITSSKCGLSNSDRRCSRVTWRHSISRSRYTDPSVEHFMLKNLKFWSVEIQIEYGGRGTALNLNTSVYSPDRCLCHITFCNYKCNNINLSPTVLSFFTFIYNEPEWIPVCWRWSISPSCNIICFTCCRMGLSQLAFLRV